MIIRNETRGTLVADKVEVARSFLKRGIGLMGRRSLPDGFALVLRPCGSIHMFFMFVPLDVLHMDKHGHVLRILRGIKPWRIGPIVPRGKWVIELPVGAAERSRTQVGDTIVVVEEE